jgi:hypothetical protein
MEIPSFLFSDEQETDVIVYLVHFSQEIHISSIEQYSILSGDINNEYSGVTGTICTMDS